MANLQELEAGLKAADAAGNAEDAQAFADEIRKMQAQPTNRFAALGKELESAQAWEANPDRKDPTGGLLVDIGLEAGLPAAAQAATSELPIVGQAAAGGAAGFVGNALAQLRRMSAGEQEGFKWGEATAGATMGAIPVGGPAKAAEKVTLARAALNAAKEGVKLAGASAGAEALKTAIDEGRLPTLREEVAPTLVGGAAGAAGSALAAIGGNRIARGNRLRQNIEELAAIPGAASPGMLMPEEFAAFEGRQARLDPSGPVADRVDQALSGFSGKMNAMAPNPQEGSAIFQQVQPKLGEISRAESSLSQLNEKAIAAQQKERAALEALQATRTKGEEVVGDAQAKLADAVDSASKEAMQANLDSALENAQQIGAARVAGGVNGISPAEARDLMVQGVAKPAKEAMEARAEAMFEPFNSNLQLFNTEPILSELESLSTKLTGGLPKKANTKLGDIVAHLEDNPLASLQDLRNLRTYLRQGVNFGEVGNTFEDRVLKQAASKVTETMNEQAGAVFGDEMVGKFREANAYYARMMQALDNLGADILFAKGAGDESVEKFLTGIRKNGIGSDEYKGLQQMLGVVREENPALAAQLEQHANDTIKASVIFQASSPDIANPNALKVDPQVLFKAMDEIGRVPGSLEKLGLGGSEALADLKTVFAKYPEASSLDKAQWEQLMASPSFAKASGGSIAAKAEQVLAKTQAENQLLKAAFDHAAGNLDAAERKFAAATATASDAGIEANEVRTAYEKLVQDPVAVAFNNPNLSADSFNSFASALFDPKASRASNADVESVVQALSRSPSPADRALLSQLRERYIADKLAVYRNATISEDMLKEPDVKAIASFFNPVNPGDAANDIARARTLLTPAQMRDLEQMAVAARNLARYEKLGGSPILPGSYNVPVVGGVRRAVDALTDLYRQHAYNRVAKALVDPAGYANALGRQGRMAQAVADPFERFGLGLSRSLSNVPQSAQSSRQPGPAR